MRYRTRRLLWTGLGAAWVLLALLTALWIVWPSPQAPDGPVLPSQTSGGTR